MAAEHQIRTAIKAYLDAGGDPDFYIVSKRLMYNAQRNVVDRLLSKVHKDETTDNTGFNISKKRVGELGQEILDELKRPATAAPKGVKF